MIEGEVIEGEVIEGEVIEGKVIMEGEVATLPTWWYSRKTAEPPASVVLKPAKTSSERLISFEALETPPRTMKCTLGEGYFVERSLAEAGMMPRSGED